MKFRCNIRTIKIGFGFAIALAIINCIFLINGDVCLAKNILNPETGKYSWSIMGTGLLAILHAWPVFLMGLIIGLFFTPLIKRYVASQEHRLSNN